MSKLSRGMDTYYSLLAAAPQDVRAYEVEVGVGAIALAAAVLALIALAWMWRSTAPRVPAPAAAGIELGPETPALADLLTGGFVVEDDAVPATVVDLAARGYFTIEDQGPQTIIRTRQRRPVNDSLVPYEQRVLDHIERHSKNGVVPTPVLTLGPRGVSNRWVKGFRRDVVTHGQALGLCRPRWNFIHMAGAWGLVAIITLLVWVATETSTATSDVNGWLTLGNILLAVAGLLGLLLLYGAIRIVSFHAQTDTPAGRTAAAHWMGVRTFYRDTGEFEKKPASSVAVWDRHLAYATALGLAPTVQRQIPFETEHNRHAWSHETGDWRRVTVRYRSLLPGRGRHPLLAVFVGLITAAIFGALAAAGFYLATEGLSVQTRLAENSIDMTDEARQWIGLGGLVGTVLFGAFAVFGVLQIFLGAADLFRRRTLEGTLVRRREFGGGDDSEPTRYLAIDDGTSDNVLAYKVRSSIYSQAGQGARVSIEYSPWLGYVKRLNVLEPSPYVEPVAMDLSAAEAALVSVTNRFAAAAMAGTGALQLRSLENLKAPDGTPVLDQVGADGQTLRQQLAANRTQLQALQHDPRIANSPMRGFLDSLMSGGAAGGAFGGFSAGTPTAVSGAPADSPPPPPT
ncbi:MAG TPA: hypothetical protein VMM60_08810 [Ilumatobacter sp.]|nr:hypothetical protein [Ilumatobacter sp.]